MVVMVRNSRSSLSNSSASVGGAGRVGPASRSGGKGQEDIFEREELIGDKTEAANVGGDHWRGGQREAGWGWREGELRVDVGGWRGHPVTRPWVRAASHVKTAKKKDHQHIFLAVGVSGQYSVPAMTYLHVFMGVFQSTCNRYTGLALSRPKVVMQFILHNDYRDR